MKITDMLNMPLEVQEQYVAEYGKRRAILNAMKNWRSTNDELQKELAQIRRNCTHPLENVKKVWDEDDYGKLLDTGYIDYTCPDCGNRRSETF